MQLSEFAFELPETLIANVPTKARTGSRLLSLDASSGEIQHGDFPDLLGHLQAGDLLVFNDTRVIPARLFGHKISGGRLEVLLERFQEQGTALVQIRSNKPLKLGATFFIVKNPDDSGSQLAALRVVERREAFYVVESACDETIPALLEEFGHIPLPPYIKREDTLADRERYQTVYARQPGAVAAPTAGLHFDEALLAAINDRGVETAFLTLHVGAGTFQPVRVDDVESHRMHSEWIEVNEDVCEAVKRCKMAGRRVIAVGTTSVRSLETAAQAGMMAPFRGETDIFIYPGYEFRVVDAMVTNFHLPESTLLMLVSAFASKKMLLDAYKEAIERQYRFFSYGDAMFLFRRR